MILNLLQRFWVQKNKVSHFDSYTVAELPLLAISLIVFLFLVI